MVQKNLVATGETRTERVAIVGGGAAGTILALQLAERGILTTIFDRCNAFGRGVAYSAAAPWHRLNVPIDKMGGWRADDSDEAFFRWFVANRGALSARYADRYVARSVYGAWLRDELDQAVAAGRVELKSDEIVSAADAGGAVRLGLADGRTHIAALTVLCLGNQKPRPLAVTPPGRCIEDIWAPGAMDGIAGEEPVLIVGSGATGIDALLELHHRGQRGTIYLLSRRGLLPLIDAPPKAYAPKRTIVEDPPRLRRVIRLLRAEARDAGAAGHPWQSVVDAFRAHLPRLWSGMTSAERSRFLRHLRPYWLVHRHRLAPDIAELLTKLREERRVVVLRGRLRAAKAEGGGLRVDITGHRGNSVSLSVGRLMNCTGPEEDFLRLDAPLVSHLFKCGMARPGPFGVGFDVDADGRLYRTDGTPQSRLLVLGGATRTRFGEVTSAPQIRRRAAFLTEIITSTLDSSGNRT
jgi:uncharacterized NAD(P)/FAD-binding protein YdhS